MDQEHPGATTLDMQPLEVVRRMLRSQQYTTIGGPPQVVKVYKHMQAEAFVVPWEFEDGADAVRTLLGRPLLDYEALDAPAIDLDSPFGPPGSGRGDQLRAWDDLIVPAIIGDGAANRDSLLRQAVIDEWGLDERDIDEWLEFALRRGVVIDAGGGMVSAVRHSAP